MSQNFCAVPSLLACGTGEYPHYPHFSPVNGGIARFSFGKTAGLTGSVLFRSSLLLPWGNRGGILIWIVKWGFLRSFPRSRHHAIPCNLILLDLPVKDLIELAPLWVPQDRCNGK